MEKIETINQSLRDLYGIDTDTARPIFRVVWAPEQTEKRLTKFTDSGFELLEPEVRELPKYQWIPDAYVLERLVLVPEVSQKDLPTLKISYEPIWVFIGVDGFPITPALQACKFVIDCLYAALGKKSMGKYAEPNTGPISSPQELYESRKVEIDQIQNELFGDQSGLSQSTVNESGNAIIVPSNYSRRVN